MALRRSVFLTVGGFTTGLGRIGKTLLGCEETELCIRYQRLNGAERVVHQTSSVVHHRVGAERVTLRYLWRRCWSEGLSKAVVTDLVGAREALASERRQLALVLPKAFLGAIGHAVRRPRVGLTELGFLVAGTVAALAGYLRGRMSVSVGLGVATTDEWRPIPIMQIDAEGDQALVPVIGAERVWVEVLRHGQILHCEMVPVIMGSLSPIALERIRRTVAAIPVAAPAALTTWPKVTVVVPSICRDADQVRLAVEGLLALDYPDFDVVVVDNRLEPLTSPFPHMSDDPRVSVVRQAVPGVSAARNRGIEVATGEIIAFTDDDAQVSPQWLQVFVRRFAQNPALAGLGGMVQPTELAHESQLWFEEYYGGFTPNVEPFETSLDSANRDPLFPYVVGRFGAGCNFAVRREALVAVGGFRYELGTGTPSRAGEDLEMWFALANAGYTIGYEPSALVRHTHRTTRDDFFKQVYGYGIGLSAFYATVMLSRPRHVFGVLRRIPFGLRRLATVRGGSRTKKSFPPETRTIGLRGLVRGPMLLWRSRRLFGGLALPAGSLTGVRPKGGTVPRAPRS
jgi:GT2 family glycosyltransferase